MRLLSLFALVGLGVLSNGCVIVEDDPIDDRNCGLSAQRGGLILYVVDEGGDPVCGAEVVVRDGDYEAELYNERYGFIPDTCNSFSMPDRDGTYEVRVTAPGYATTTKSSVRVYELTSGCIGPGSMKVRLARAVTGCDASAALSFRVDLFDERGALVCDANVVVRDGDFQQALRPTPTSDGGCFWDGPVERPGNYEVTISKPGYETLVLPSVAVTKGPNACHVVPGSINATLVPSQGGCTANIVESLDLTIRDEGGVEICDATVIASDGAFSATLQASAGGGTCFWSGLPERSGVYDVTVSKPGYATVALEDVIVTADRCHVQPVSLDVELERVAVPPTER
jgi:hypothetical protein